MTGAKGVLFRLRVKYIAALPLTLQCVAKIMYLGRRLVFDPHIINSFRNQQIPRLAAGLLITFHGQMAYEVTATRKRPQTFDQMAGQDFVVTTLKASVESGKIAHAYLFSGPRGIGKTSAARILARSLNCVKGSSATPCGECENCIEIARGNSFDVIEIDGASNTSVNDVREIKDEVLFSPNSSPYKIYIIDEVHMLSNSAFNALLKTIEEPPPYVVFIFATTEVHKVPATIRSRCQQFNFRLISMDVIKEQLAAVVAEMGMKAEDDALFWIAKEATGSLRDAYTLFDQIASFSDKQITLELIRDKLGLVGLDRINQLVEHLVAGDAKKAIELADEILTQGVSVDQFVIDLAEFFRCALFIKHGIEKEALIGFSVDRFSRKIVDGLTNVQLEKALNLVLALYRELRYSLNQRYELELVLSRLSVLGSYIHPRDILQTIKVLREDISSPTVTSQGVTLQEESSNQQSSLDLGDSAVSQSRLIPEELSTEPKEPATPVDRGVDESVERELTDTERESVLASLRGSHLSLASSLAKATSWKIRGSSMMISCQMGFDAANIRKEHQTLTSQIAASLGKSYIVQVVSEQNGAEQAEVESDEKIEMIRRVFRGEIVDE